MKYDRFVPWLVEHELWVFLIPFLFLVAVGLGSC